MTITKRNDRWYDENNNSWITEESATQYSPTLTDCRWCGGCRDCSGCSGCSGCSYCSRCTYCSNCINCNSCRSCSGCRSCIDCSSCSSCSYRGDWIDNKKYEPVIRPFIDCTNRLLDPYL